MKNEYCCECCKEEKRDPIFEKLHSFQMFKFLLTGTCLGFALVILGPKLVDNSVQGFVLSLLLTIPMFLILDELFLGDDKQKR